MLKSHAERQRAYLQRKKRMKTRKPIYLKKENEKDWQVKIVKQ